MPTSDHVLRFVVDIIVHVCVYAVRYMYTPKQTKQGFKKQSETMQIYTTIARGGYNRHKRKRGDGVQRKSKSHMHQKS